MARILIPQHTSRKPGGWAISTGPSGITENETQMCCHCGTHWVIKPGSGTQRGFCTGCNSLHCGAPGCIDCFAFEKRLDQYEKGILPSLVW